MRDLVNRREMKGGEFAQKIQGEKNVERCGLMNLLKNFL
jgi:hypothetical protein